MSLQEPAYVLSIRYAEETEAEGVAEESEHPDAEGTNGAAANGEANGSEPLTASASEEVGTH
jgi:hypothetical protein